jgi:hypothetical protein
VSRSVLDWCWSCGVEFPRTEDHECDPGPARSVVWAPESTPAVLVVTEEALENLTQAIRDGKADTP